MANTYFNRAPTRTAAGLVVALVLVCLAGCSDSPTATPAAQSGKPPARPEVVLAAASIMSGSGLLDALLANFGRLTGYSVRAVALESAAALEMGRQGTADILLVHAPEAEQAFLKSGQGVDSHRVLESRFVIAGPPADPAQVRGKPVLEALKGIAATGSTFVSRRDNSDTNILELGLWQEALGRDAQHEGWYVSTHNGMNPTLDEANRRRAYTFTDLASFTGHSVPQLTVLVKDDPLLRAGYDAIVMNPQRWPQVNAEGARALEAYLISPDAQTIITEYGATTGGEHPFLPASQAAATP